VAVPKQPEQPGFVPDAARDLFIVRPLCIEQLDRDDAGEAVGVHHLAQKHRPEPTGRNLPNKVEPTRGLP
jgi:hypothetical protein